MYHCCSIRHFFLRILGLQKQSLPVFSSPTFASLPRRPETYPDLAPPRIVSPRSRLRPPRDPPTAGARLGRRRRRPRQHPRVVKVRCDRQRFLERSIADCVDVQQLPFPPPPASPALWRFRRAGSVRAAVSTAPPAAAGAFPIGLAPAVVITTARAQGRGDGFRASARARRRLPPRVLRERRRGDVGHGGEASRRRRH